MAEKHLFNCIVEQRATLMIEAETQEEAEEIALSLIHNASYNIEPGEGWVLVDETEKVEDEW